jgi:tetratricopeptide (TPR) repeat protein
MKIRKSTKRTIYTSIILMLLIAVVILNTKYKIFNCNMKRDHDAISEKHYQKVKDKIVMLEEKEPKDASVKKRLVEQYNNIGIHYLNKKMLDLAIESFNNSIKYGNNTADVFYSLGLAHSGRSVEKKSSDDINQAEYYYRKAISINGKLYDAKYGLAVLLYNKNGVQDESINLINDILSKNMAHYQARFASGRFQYELGNKREALAIYQRLSADIDKMPSSIISNEYKTLCSNNIQRIKSELDSE